MDIGEEAAEAFRLPDHGPIAVELDVVGPGGSDVWARAPFEEIRALVRETNEKVEELSRLIPELGDAP